MLCRTLEKVGAACIAKLPHLTHLLIGGSLIPNRSLKNLGKHSGQLASLHIDFRWHGKPRTLKALTALTGLSLIRLSTVNCKEGDDHKDTGGALHCLLCKPYG